MHLLPVLLWARTSEVGPEVFDIKTQYISRLIKISDHLLFGGSLLHVDASEKRFPLRLTWKS